MASASVEIDAALVRSAASQRGMFIRDLAASGGIGVSSVHAAIASGRCGIRVVKGIAKSLGMDPKQIIKPPPARAEGRPTKRRSAVA